jgi:hypothetical protein
MALVEQSAMRLTTAIVVVIAVCGYAVWLNVRLASIDYKLAELAASAKAQWTYRDMVQWARLFEEMNKGPVPALRVPQIDFPR